MKRRPPSQAPASPEAVEEALRAMRAERVEREGGYRERSLKLHGTICARCGRDFPAAKRHLLTVHHKDGNPANNPPDGSNWENLCVFCHDAEHSRELLGDYEAGSPASASARAPEPEAKGAALGSFAELFAKAGKKSGG